jgi:hypothetical protein
MNSPGHTGYATVEMLAALSPLLKPVEAIASFQKTRNQLGEQSLSGGNLRFTYVDSTDFTQRPYANLFTSLHLPSTANERRILRDRMTGTALSNLAAADRFILVEIPRDLYGEMVDGKSIELDIPQVNGDAHVTTTLYSSYYGFNPDLNNQVSDANPISSLFSGVEPVAENEFNTNVSYLFCNDIAKPKDSIIFDVVYDKTGAASPILQPGAQDYQVLPGTGLQKGVVYKTTLAFVNDSFLLTVVTPFGELAYDDAVDTSVSDYSFTKFKYDVTAIRVVNREGVAYGMDYTISVPRIVSSREWNNWSPNNRFPTVSGGAGKAVARLNDANYSILVDEPVGIAYLDKGFLVITHPTLISAFDLSLAKVASSDGDLVPYLAPDDGTVSFTNISFAAANASLKFRSITSEYSQSYTCLAMPDEFYDTTNPTFRQAYPVSTSSTQQPLQITEIGLYNVHGELVAIAKAKKPLVKTRSSVAIFNVSLKI